MTSKTVKNEDNKASKLDERGHKYNTKFIFLKKKRKLCLLYKHTLYRKRKIKKDEKCKRVVNAENVTDRLRF